MTNADPSTLRRILRNNQTNHQTRGSHRQHYLHSVITRSHGTTEGNELTLVLLLDEIPHVTWRDFAEEFNIIVRMELCHFALGRRLGTLEKTTPDDSE
jgi:hypothetical protein